MALGRVSAPGGRWRAALIDLDGTLVDTLGDFEAALARTLVELGAAPVSRHFIERTVGKGSEHLIRQTLAHARVDPDRYDEAWQSYQRHYAAVNGEHAPVFPGVVEGLARLAAAGWPLVCLTNKPTVFAIALLERKGLAGRFQQVFGGDAFAHKKPHPMPLLEACRALGVAPAGALMVGDSANDAQAAHAAGCGLALVRYGYNHGEPIDAVRADIHADSLDEIAVWALALPPPG